jgi:hypothetical protein
MACATGSGTTSGGGDADKERLTHLHCAVCAVCAVHPLGWFVTVLACGSARTGAARRPRRPGRGRSKCRASGAGAAVRVRAAEAGGSRGGAEQQATAIVKHPGVFLITPDRRALRLHARQRAHLDHRGPACAAVLPRVPGRCVKGPARVKPTSTDGTRSASIRPSCGTFCRSETDR